LLLEGLLILPPAVQGHGVAGGREA
jgi:hypothetical protein